MRLRDDLLDVLLAIHEGEITVSSNYAQEKALLIAMAASKGLITTKIHMDVYGRTWRLTVGGMTLLNEFEIELDNPAYVVEMMPVGGMDWPMNPAIGH